MLRHASVNCFRCNGRAVISRAASLKARTDKKWPVLAQQHGWEKKEKNSVVRDSPARRTDRSSGDRYQAQTSVRHTLRLCCQFQASCYLGAFPLTAGVGPGAACRPGHDDVALPCDFDGQRSPLRHPFRRGCVAPPLGAGLGEDLLV